MNSELGIFKKQNYIATTYFNLQLLSSRNCLQANEYIRIDIGFL